MPGQERKLAREPELRAELERRGQGELPPQSTLTAPPQRPFLSGSPSPSPTLRAHPMSKSPATRVSQQEEDSGARARSADLSAQARVPRDEAAESLPARPQKPSPHSPSPPPQRCHGGSSIGAAARPRVHIRATEPAARMCGYAAPRVPSPSSERHGAGRRRARASASKRGAPSAAGAAGSARCDASQAEPRRRRGRSRSLPRARRSPLIRTRPWRPLRPARTLLSLPEVALKRRGES